MKRKTATNTTPTATNNVKTSSSRKSSKGKVTNSSSSFGYSFYIVTCVLFYFIGFVSDFFMFHIYPSLIKFTYPETQTLFGTRVFLTLLNHEIQMIYMFFSLLLYVFFFFNPSRFRSPSSLANYIQDRFFILCLIISLIVGIFFWGLYFTNRELIFPSAYQNIYPVALNYYQHLLVVVLMLIDLVLVPHKMHFKMDLAILAVFGICYMTISIMAYSTLGRWTYPFLNMMSNFQIAIMFAVSLIFGLVLLCITHLILRVKNYKQKQI